MGFTRPAGATGIYPSCETKRPFYAINSTRHSLSPTATVIFNILLLFCATCGLIASVLVVVALKCVGLTPINHKHDVHNCTSHAESSRAFGAVDSRNVPRYRRRVRSLRLFVDKGNGNSIGKMQPAQNRNNVLLSPIYSCNLTL